MEENHQRIAALLIELNKQADPEDLFPTLAPSAAEFNHANPYAFCLATCLDRGTKADIIWTIPFWMFQILGHLDPKKIYRMTLAELGDLVNRLPKKPRYINAAPQTIQDLTKIVVEKYKGDAEGIWAKHNALEVRKVFLSVYGVGPGIANMAAVLIEKMYGFQFSDLDHTRMDIKPDVHTMRVLYRLGVAAAVQEDEAVRAARYLNPVFPGEIDGSLWHLGREFCNASKPFCYKCPMRSVCPRVDV